MLALQRLATAGRGQPRKDLSMRVSIAAALTGAALVALGACNRPAPANAAAPGAGAGTAAASGPLALNQIPHRKPGLWKQTMTMDGAAPAGPGMQLCVDEASEAKMSAFAQRMPGGAHCPPAQFTRNLDGTVSFSESCDMGANGKSASTGTIKGDFNSGYTEEIDTQYSGSPVAQINGDHKMTITATWTGPCAAGQRGGDLIMPNGMTRNMLDDHPATAGGGQ
jgi:hypothetical protein